MKTVFIFKTAMVILKNKVRVVNLIATEEESLVVINFTTSELGVKLYAIKNGIEFNHNKLG